MEKNKEKSFCCEYMCNSLEDIGSQVCYDAELRLYYVPRVHNQGAKLQSRQVIWYCPWCGAKLPHNLQDEYYTILLDEYGIQWEDIVTKEKQVPEEFKSDAWWKKRRL